MTNKLSNGTCANRKNRLRFFHHKNVVHSLVTFKGKSRRLMTTLTCTPSDLTRTLKIKNPTILNKSEALIAEMRDAVKDLSPFDLEGHDVDWVVSHVRGKLSQESFRLDFFEWSEKYILTKTETTRRAYSCALNTFERFLGKREIDINDISRGMLLDFMEFVDAEPKMHYNRATQEWEKTDKEKVAKASSSLHLMKLQHIFNAAKDRYNDEDSDNIRIPKSPFDSIRKVFPSGGKGQKALDRKTIQRMIVAQTDDASVRVALDAFLVSFALMGANLADLYLATPIAGKEWVYNRQKTAERREDKAEMRVMIPPQIEGCIRRLQEGGDGEWWLPELHRIGEKKHTCNARINDYLRRWQNKAGVEDFTFYAARHSWATIARSMGVDLASVNDCLCHKDNLEMGRRYAPLTWEQKNEINMKVVESFVW